MTKSMQNSPPPPHALVLETKSLIFNFFMATLRFYFVSLFIATLLVVCSSNANLSPNFYDSSCPSLGSIVRATMREAVNRELRIAASILRLFFHDCFVLVSASLLFGRIVIIC